MNGIWWEKYTGNYCLQIISMCDKNNKIKIIIKTLKIAKI